MFGLSFGEVVLLALIAMIVVGPRNLPTMLRTLGRTIGKLKRMTVEIREQTGIDEILRGEGIEKEMEQLRMIASGRILDVDLADDPADEHPPRYREYPRMGVDSYDAIPEDTAPYVPVEASNAPPVVVAAATPGAAEPALPAPSTDAPAPSTDDPTSPPADEANKRVRISTVPDAPAGLSRGSRRSSASFDDAAFDNPHSAPAPEPSADAPAAPDAASEAAVATDAKAGAGQ